MTTASEFAARCARMTEASRLRRRRAAIAQRRHRVKCALLTPLALVGVVLIGQALVRTEPPTWSSTAWLGLGCAFVVAWIAAAIDA